MTQPPDEIRAAYRVADQVTIEDFGDELVLFSLNSRKGFLANRIGRLVILTIQAGQPLSLLVERLSEVSGDRGAVEEDIRAFLNEALKDGVLVIK